MRSALDRVAAGEPDPPCQHCGGILKSDTISFGQALDQRTLRRAFSSVLESDVLITIGTSLQVHPVAGLVDLALGAKAKVIIVNAEPTPYDEDVRAVLRQPIGDVLPEIARAVLN
jgi:NAD-dependent deacetylase